MNFISTILMVVCLGTSAPAQKPIQRDYIAKDRTALIEQNIEANLQSENIGVQASTIQLIIDLSKTEKAKDLDYTVIPLLDLLKTSKYPEVRILAALGLYHLNSDLGRFAVSRRIAYDDSERVANMCKHITKAWETEAGNYETGFAYTRVNDM